MASVMTQGQRNAIVKVLFQHAPCTVIAALVIEIAEEAPETGTVLDWVSSYQLSLAAHKREQEEQDRLDNDGPLNDPGRRVFRM